MTDGLADAYRAWLGDCVPIWVLLPDDLIPSLVNAEIGPSGGVRIAEHVPIEELSTLPAFSAITKLLRAIDGGGAAPVDAAGELDRSFLGAVAQDLPQDLVVYAAAIVGLMGYLHIDGSLVRLTDEGRAKVAELEQTPERAARFFGDVVAATLTTYNLGFLDDFELEGFPQSHIALVLYLLGQTADEPMAASELARLASMPTEMSDRDDLDEIALAFEARVLRYLVWFGTMKACGEGAYKRTERFNRLFKFNIAMKSADEKLN